MDNHTQSHHGKQNPLKKSVQPFFSSRPTLSDETIPKKGHKKTVGHLWHMENICRKHFIGSSSTDSHRSEKWGSNSTLQRGGDYAYVSLQYRIWELQFTTAMQRDAFIDAHLSTLSTHFWNAKQGSMDPILSIWTISTGTPLIPLFASPLFFLTWKHVSSHQT